MKVTLEPIVFIMRFHEDDNAILGDPYTASATISIDSDGVATVKGFTSKNEYNKSYWDAANDEFYKIGIKKIVFHRKKDGKDIPISRLVKPPKNDI